MRTSEWEGGGMTGTIDQQLAASARRIDELDARGRSAADQERIRRRVDVLHREWASTLAAARRTPDQADELITRLRLRLEVADRSLDADLAVADSAYAERVEAELYSWHRFAERVQATAAARSGRARKRAEATVTKLRRKWLYLAQTLDDLLAESGEARVERRARVDRARRDLEQLADDLSTSTF
jgi:hypothetical protein